MILSLPKIRGEGGSWEAAAFNSAGEIVFIGGTLGLDIGLLLDFCRPTGVQIRLEIFFASGCRELVIPSQVPLVFSVAKRNIANMASDYVQVRELAFHETDMAGIAHFSNFFRWMEQAEHAFLKTLGIEPVVQDGEKFWGWPRVRASCEYHAPVRYGEKFEVHLFVKEIKQKSVVYFFRFRKVLANGSMIPLAKGEMTAVYAGFDVPTRSMVALDLAEEVISNLELATPEAMKRARSERP